MKISRRALLKSLAGIVLLSGIGLWLKARFRPKSVTNSLAQESSGAPPLEQTFRSFIDTLIPADEMPGAVDLGVAEKILEQSKNQTTFSRLIKQGCAWLDEQAIKNGPARFMALDEQQRIRIVTLASESKQNSMEYVFFASVRDLSFSEYYTDPRTWPGLGYDGPPQPRGFLEYTSAPMNADAG